MQDSIYPKRLRRSPRARLLAVVTLVSVIGVAGCAGGSAGPTVASVSSTANTTPSAVTTDTTSASTSSAAIADAALAFSNCMRSNGVPHFPDPQAGGGFVFQKGAGVDPSSFVFKAAQTKCRKLLPGGGPPGPGTQTHPSPQALAQLVKAAECMRRHGIYNFPDPRTSVPSSLAAIRVVSDIDGVILVFPAAINEQSPAFTRAAAACNFPLHNR